MISCKFENKEKALLRHVVTHAIVEDKDKMLLIKRAENLSESGKWALPGGYLDRDETAKQGVLRELKEETGWTGEIIDLFRINTNPNRPHEDRQNVVLEFLVKPIKKIQEHNSESTKVEWIPIKKLIPFSEFAFDHGETIKLYLEYRNKPYKLPILF